MTRNNQFRFMILLVMVSGILILPAMAVTLDIKDAAFSDIGETQKIEITLVGATDGPGGYVIQLELADAPDSTEGPIFGATTGNFPDSKLFVGDQDFHGDLIFHYICMRP